MQVASCYCQFAPLSLPKERRVVRSSEFRSTYKAGTRISSRFFVVFCRKAARLDLSSRFGFTCPRALGKAVIRNRIKRRMREAVRAEVGVLPNGWVLVFNPRRSVLDAGYSDLCKEVNRILAKCNASSSVS